MLAETVMRRTSMPVFRAYIMRRNKVHSWCCCRNCMAAYIFAKPAGGWGNMSSHTAKLVNSDGAAGDFLGHSVALDGLTAVAGASFHDTLGNFNQGAAYVFTGSPAGWSDMDETAKLRAIEKDDNFGNSVAMSGDTVVVGARFHDTLGNNSQGAAYVFVRTGSGWTDMLPAARLTASDGAEWDNFGNSVAMSGDTVVVGALGNADQGAAYVFVRPSSGWTTMIDTAKLTASDGIAGDHLGWSVDIMGDTVVAGAPSSSIVPGAAYVFVQPNSGWTDMTETAKLTPSDGVVSDEFGDAVAVDNNTVVVGAPDHNSFKGATYIYTRPQTGWKDTTETAKLTASDGAADDLLGWCVDIRGNIVVAGAPLHATGGNTFQGAAYVFERPSSGWAAMTETDKLVASDGVENDEFGMSVAISDRSVAIGSLNKEFTDRVNGAIYMYRYPKFPWAMFLPAINSGGQ